MSLLAAAAAVFVGFGLMSMAGLGAATLFIPIFYYSGVPLPEAISTGLLLNVVSLGFAVPGYFKTRSVNLRIGVPILIVAALLAPVGAAVSHSVDHDLLLGLFAAFLVAVGAMMLFYRRPIRPLATSRKVEVVAGTTVGSGVGFLAGLLGVGGGAFVLPILHGIGLETKKASGTTALVALASSVSGFAARATLGSIDPAFAAVTSVAAAAGAYVASRFASRRLTSASLKRIVAVILWLIAARMIWDVLR